MQATSGHEGGQSDHATVSLTPSEVNIVKYWFKEGHFYSIYSIETEFQTLS